MLIFLFPLLILHMLPVIADTNFSAYDVLIVSKDSQKPFAYKLTTFYQKRISPHDGAKCLYYPTCSEFYKKALSSYGFFWGTVMTVDRLFYREGIRSMKYYQYIAEKERYFDPVYHNYIFKKIEYYR